MCLVVVKQKIFRVGILMFERTQGGPCGKWSNYKMVKWSNGQIAKF